MAFNNENIRGCPLLQNPHFRRLPQYRAFTLIMFGFAVASTIPAQGVKNGYRKTQ
jgi:hypothetical protein